MRRFSRLIFRPRTQAIFRLVLLGGVIGFALSVLSLSNVAHAADAHKHNANQRGDIKAFYFQSRSPNSELRKIAAQLKLGPANRLKDYDLKGHTFELYIPKSYDDTKAFGILVWASTANDGRLPHGDWRGVCEKHNLIFVGVNGMASNQPPNKRAGLLLDAVHNVDEHYKIDEDRIYLIAKENGCDLVGKMLSALPEPFVGAIFINGIYDIKQARSDPQISDKFRLAIIINESTKHRKQLEEVIAKWYQPRRKKLEQSYHLAPLKGESMPDTAVLTKAVTAMDESLAKSTRLLLGAGRRYEGTKAYGRAWHEYAKVLGRNTDEKYRKQAKEAVAGLRDKLKADVGTFDELMTGEKTPQARILIERTLPARWGDWARDEIATMTEALAAGQTTVALAAAKATPPKPTPDPPKPTPAKIDVNKLLVDARAKMAKDPAAAYKALKQLADKHEKTPAGLAAKIEVAQIEADPEKRKQAGVK